MRTPVPDTAIALAQTVLDAAFDVHSRVGPGCFERVYEHCLATTLAKRGLHVERQRAFELRFEEEVIPLAFRADLVVNDLVIVELKVTSEILPIHHAQLRTYLHASGKPVGLLLNFGAALMKDGYDRLVHRAHYLLPPSRRLASSGARVLGPSGAAPQGSMDR